MKNRRIERVEGDGSYFLVAGEGDEKEFSYSCIFHDDYIHR